nr:16S rRNA (cytidine(1402)-2'-O)-methyltransferase [Ardenticatena sp.]
MGTLYIVGTPIGNLEDITLRALRILREVALIAAEDTRRTRKLLAHYDIHTPLTSYHEHNRFAKLPVILDALTRGDVALVSDAGMPGISDPGVELVQAAVQAGHTVSPLPGPSALIAALVASGLPTEAFAFFGFLPRKPDERRARLQDLAAWPHTLIFYEAPHRLAATLEDMAALLGGERRIVIARELTKLHEAFWRGTLAEAVAMVHETPPRGEITLVVEGAPPATPADPDQWSRERVETALRRLAAEGITGSRAVKQVARLSGWPRDEVYATWLGMTPDEDEVEEDEDA